MNKKLLNLKRKLDKCGCTEWFSYIGSVLQNEVSLDSGITIHDLVEAMETHEKVYYLADITSKGIVLDGQKLMDGLSDDDLAFLEHICDELAELDGVSPFEALINCGANAKQLIERLISDTPYATTISIDQGTARSMVRHGVDPTLIFNHLSGGHLLDSLDELLKAGLDYDRIDEYHLNRLETGAEIRIRMERFRRKTQKNRKKEVVV